MQYLTIDFGGTLVKYSVMDENCKVFERKEEKSPVESRELFLDFICRLYEEYKSDYEIGGIAVSMPGIIDGRNGLIQSAGAFLSLYGMNLCEELKDRLPVPFTVENDGKCGALAEVWQGNLKEQDDGIVLLLGTGVAGGIIKDRQIHRGKNLSAGEFSYILMGEEPGFYGTALYKCSVSALLFEACRRKGIDVRKSTNYELLSHFLVCSQELSEMNDLPEYAQGMNGYQFFELLEQGDADIRELYEDFTKNLARLILNLQLIYAPEKVLVGGGISRQPRLISDIRRQYDALEKTFLGVFPVPCKIDTCRFGNEANQYGALYHFLRQHVIREG